MYLKLLLSLSLSAALGDWTLDLHRGVGGGPRPRLRKSRGFLDTTHRRGTDAARFSRAVFVVVVVVMAEFKLNTGPLDAESKALAAKELRETEENVQKGIVELRKLLEGNLNFSFF